MVEISLTEEAYERLRSERRKEESLSDVVLRLTEDGEEDFSNLVGVGTDASFADLKQTREE